MSEIKRYEHWSVKIEDGDTPTQIIEVLSQLPPDTKADLAAETYHKIWLRFQRDDTSN